MIENRLRDYVIEKQKLIIQFLDSNLPKMDKKSDILLEAIRYSLFSRGKKTRSILSIMTAEMFDCYSSEILFPASAIELIHTYSLIHDDLPSIDNDDFRRGQKSNHKKYGEAIAILSGDSCLTFAFELITMMDMSSEIIVKIIKQLSNSVGVEGMIGGQVADIKFSHNLFSDNEKSNTLEYIHYNKTAKFIQASMLIGMFVANIFSETEISKISSCGEKIGLAFQIMDDILDQNGNQENMGKTLGKDKQYQKLTYPSVYGMDYSKKKVNMLIEQSLDILSSFNSSNLIRAFIRNMKNRNN